ncbi:hypothetical protein [Coleofasciculus sp. FACHB-1120]|uniref:hypothetical protein n=1 Tax=Coleofasciculus sp. FACHB-1120 TaxID=2692783 RepID=UPI001688533F|nr:hypothetical protein [Coleofasciculus sp. FACHB-1120]MBD2741789.1 hypothetical protein [Coleofasciculus sp. FACHB-1120]
MELFEACFTIRNEEWLTRVVSLLYEVGWLPSEVPAIRNRGYTEETRRKREKMSDRF